MSLWSDNAPIADDASANAMHGTVAARKRSSGIIKQVINCDKIGTVKANPMTKIAMYSAIAYTAIPNITANVFLKAFICVLSLKIQYSSNISTNHVQDA